jgi:XTP/dITP diphosphohydrolase
LYGLGELHISPPEESGSSFLENALLKARHAAAAASAAPAGTALGGIPLGGTPLGGIPLGGTPPSDAAALADDSGLEVDALGGAPGIYSARYAGSGADDSANNAKLMAALEGTRPDQRRARYRCALVFVRSALDVEPLIAEGVWEGLILDAPRGSGGFGYDPYFFLPELGLTAAELDAAAKNRLSHRGIAMRALRDQLAARE